MLIVMIHLSPTLINTMSVAVFPASGGLGTATVDGLLKQLRPSDLTLISRHPEQHAPLATRGVTTRKADFDDAGSFKGMFAGVKVLNLISYPSIQDEHRFEVGATIESFLYQVARAAIDAAIDQGVKHIFYSSLAFGGDTDCSVTQVMAAHLRTEAYLKQLSSSSRLTYTIIRQGLYSTSYPIYTGFFDVTKPGDGIVRIPHNGTGPGISWAKREELGEATAGIIAAYVREPTVFPHICQRIILSGPKTYSLSETADVFSSVLGREVKILQITAEEYATSPTAKAGFPAGEEDWPRLWATAWEGIRRGEACVVTSDLQRWLGREPEDFVTTIRDIVIKATREIQ